MRHTTPGGGGGGGVGGNARRVSYPVQSPGYLSLSPPLVKFALSHEGGKIVAKFSPFEYMGLASTNFDIHTAHRNIPM